MSDIGSEKYREQKAKAFKQWPISASAETVGMDENHSQKVTKNVALCERDIEQRVLLNSLDIMQGALWMLKREYYRHQKDCLNILADIRKLEAMNVTLPPNLRLDLWFEIPSCDPRTGKGVK